MKHLPAANEQADERMLIGLRSIHEIGVFNTPEPIAKQIAQR